MSTSTTTSTATAAPDQPNQSYSDTTSSSPSTPVGSEIARRLSRSTSASAITTMASAHAHDDPITRTPSAVQVVAAVAAEHPSDAFICERQQQEEPIDHSIIPQTTTSVASTAANALDHTASDGDDDKDNDNDNDNDEENEHEHEHEHENMNMEANIEANTNEGEDENDTGHGGDLSEDTSSYPITQPFDEDHTHTVTTTTPTITATGDGDLGNGNSVGNDSDGTSTRHPASIHSRHAADQDNREGYEPEIESDHGAAEDNHLHVPIFFDETSNNSSRREEDNRSDQTVLNPRRVWESDRQAAECRRCGRRFNFLVRRHHCRRCGQVVCDRCSGHRIHLPPEDIIQDPMVDPSHYPLIALHPQRVCDACIRLPVKQIASSSSNHQPAPMHMKRTGSTQSLMSECPVCGRPLLGMQKHDQENHLQQCLNTGSPPVRPPRYIVYELSDDSPQISYECPICFDEFKAGDKVARMICLCSYHRQCLTDWLERGKGCPVHYDATL